METGWHAGAIIIIMLVDCEQVWLYG